MQIDLSDRRLYNDKYIPYITSRKRYHVLYGSRDSSKSYSTAQKIVFHLLNEEYCKVICVRKIFADIKDSQIETIWSVIQAWNLTDLFQKTVSPLEIRCLVNGNKVLARGMDKSTKLKSIDSPTIAWLEEADELTYADYIKIDTSLRSGGKNDLISVLVTFNPEDADCWMVDEFFPPLSSFEKEDGDFTMVESPKPNTYLMHSTWRDNRFCSEERGAMYMALKQSVDSNYYRVYCQGLFGNPITGLIFPKISYADEMPPLENRKYPGIGIDYGFSDITAVVECCLGPEGKVYVQEVCGKSGLAVLKNPANPHYPSLQQVLEDEEIPKEWQMICDSAHPGVIQDLVNSGYRARGCKKGPGSVLSRIQNLQRFEIVVCGGSPNLKKALASYCWKTDRNGNPMKEPAHTFSHFPDAIMYWHSHFVKSNPMTKGGRVIFG